jgi:hypothetical protein
MLSSLAYAVFGFVDLLVGLRFIFLLLGANPASQFVNWVYSWSGPLVTPFSGIFGQHITIAGHGAVVQGVFDWSALIALIIYAFIGGILAKILSHS